MKRNKKTFWTLDRHHAAGFTLVELIVVIAILAILAGVGIPVYSGYITKTNMAADETLVSEIKNAIILAYYADPDAFEAGSIVLSMDADPVMDNTFLTDAVKKVYGDNLAGVRLKHNGWTAKQSTIKLSLTGSSFSPTGVLDESLLGTVDKLTGAMATIMGKNNEDATFNIEGYPGFKQHLENYGINYETDPQKAANAVVTHLANSTDDSMRGAMSEKLVNVDNWYSNGNLSFMNVFQQTNGAFNGTGTNGQFASLGATYALVKGFCLWQDEKLARDNPALAGMCSQLLDGLDLTTYNGKDVQSEFDVMNKLDEELMEAMEYYGFQDDLETYLTGGAAQKDLDAYFGVIDGIKENEAYIKENLDNSESFYSDRIDYLNAYLTVTVEEGQVAILITMGPDGVVSVRDVPQIGQ